MYATASISLCWHEKDEFLTTSANLKKINKDSWFRKYFIIHLEMAKWFCMGYQLLISQREVSVKKWFIKITLQLLNTDESITLSMLILSHHPWPTIFSQTKQQEAEGKSGVQMPQSLSPLKWPRGRGEHLAHIQRMSLQSSTQWLPFRQGNLRNSSTLESLGISPSTLTRLTLSGINKS